MNEVPPLPRQELSQTQFGVSHEAQTETPNLCQECVGQGSGRRRKERAHLTTLMPGSGAAAAVPAFTRTLRVAG